jgi:uncharacterized protein YdhG (YjbR/CyaY superfamily)
MSSIEVENYIKKQKSPQKEIIQRLRQEILKMVPKNKEEFKMGVPWYEDKFYIVALKDHVNLGFSVQGLSNNEMEILQGKGKLMRHLKFYTEADVEDAKVEKMVKLVAEKTNCLCNHKKS